MTEKFISSAMLCVALALCPPSAWPQIFDGPVTAQVLRVIDGDTIEVTAPIWPQHSVQTRIRLRGIDAPEIFRPDCAEERALGQQAKARVEALLGVQRVTLVQIEQDKFGGRFVATVIMENGQSVSTRLMLENLALPWDARGKSPSHCGEER